MGRTNLVLDEPLVAEAMRLSGIKTKRGVVDAAVREFVETRSRKSLLDLKGSRLIAEDYDYKAAREAEA